ncbi:carboxy terminal-processing peptidase [uncultured Algibacter sp.]|uniref:S41 family peptidase n=1 Tax=uncultured Algibacter sp. TaxID=298659 RepID=UPI00261A8699|nr:carboxy terminal-processing peptidase [uncultured Algibacter sp.]
MNYKYFLLFFSIFSFNALSQNDIFCDQLYGVITLVKKSHFSPKPINDSLSKEVHNLFIKSLDKNKRLFTHSDIEFFSNDKYKFDDYINSNNCHFIEPYIIKLKERIEFSKRYITQLESETLNYSGIDTLYFDSDINYPYFKNINAVKKYWSKRIRYNIISQLIENDSVFENIETNFIDLERNIKPQIIQKELCLLNELLNQNGGINQFVKESFLNSYLNYQDANSTYFNSSNKALFENQVSNSQLSFGISTIKNDKGDILISHIAPGSPADKNIGIEVDDIIKSLQFNGEVLETYCVSNNDIEAYIGDNKKQTIIFKIKKANGQILDVELTKDNIQVETNSIKGYIINGDKAIGYIKIPSFYTDLESLNGLGMANDFAKEIYKLKKEHIQGLIIDLRFNGGGSMKEASDLSGMFIDRGPVSIIKYNNQKTYTLRDYKRGAVFTNPVVILVNSFSASASELFASVLQDYNRAVIVGTPTHGKSSAQVIFPLNKSKDLGFVKLTIEKFYRPSGKSHQSVGVIPDITIPSIYDNFENQERYSSFALKNDSIKAEIKYLPNKKINIDKLQTLSKERITASDHFENISKMNTELIENYIKKKKQYPLSVKNIYKDINSYKELWEWFNNINKTRISDLVFANTISTNQIIQYDQVAMENNKTILKDLEEDVILIETYNIMLDLINLKTTN